MLTRILALVAVLLLAPSTLAHANARALSLESASLGIFARNVDLLKEIPDLTHCCIKEKSTERSESSNRREEYLRARYMDPSEGRFLGMDAFVGVSTDPLSLHKYMYVHASPANGVDPSGNYDSGQLWSIGSIEAVLAASTQQMVRELAIKAIATAITVTATTVALYQIVKARRDKSKGRIIAFGVDMKEAFFHMKDALDEGKSRILTRFEDGHPRGWWLALGICLDATIANRKDCDEYPFSASEEGGRENYGMGKVSLRSLDRSDNRRVGNLLMRFYNDPNCRFKNGPDPLMGKYAVVADVELPRSEYFCKFN